MIISEHTHNSAPLSDADATSVIATESAYTTSNGEPSELFREIRCLDKGFVRLVDYMGSDAAIVQAARVSYGAGTKQVNEDRGLIRYLVRHAHTTPLEMVEFKFHVKLPMFVARQWIRHRTANVNEYSGRYSVMKDEFYVPEPDQIRAQSSTNKQGRAEQPMTSEQAEAIIASLRHSQAIAYNEYEAMLERDVARELARINLPLALYTEWYWKIDLHNLFHFLRLRMDSHAQHEIRVYANAIASIVQRIVPLAYEAFEDYVLHAERFTQPELKALRTIVAHLPTHAIELSDDELASCGLSKREMAEFRHKLALLRSS
jgi:thymidylate synthase (FAD)